MSTINDPDLGITFAFLDQLFANTIDDGYINIFHVNRQSGERATRWAALDKLEALSEPLIELAPRGDVWVSVAPRRNQLDNGRRGGVADCVCIPAFWLDIDVASSVHRLPGLPKSYDEARRLVLSFPLPPSMVVSSGYGMQVWWLLKESLPAPDALNMLARWQLTWERIAEQAGVHIDNVSNLDRVMRLPGTYNWKGETPLKVTYRQRPRAYEHSEIAEHLDALPEQSETRTSTAHLAGTQFSKLITARRLLESIGCELVRTDANGDQHYHFPNASNEVSCTVYADDDHCAVWSETMRKSYGFELRTPYHSFALWAIIKYGGDFALAHAVLVEHGIPDLAPADKLDELLTLPSAPKAKPPERMRVSVFSAITREQVKWLWYGWLPAGKLTMLDGDPDVGKSTLSVEIAARVSTGATMPDGTEGIMPADVIMLAGEDDPEDTIVWRLLAAGADLDRVHYVHCALDDEGELPVTIPRDLPMLEELVLSQNAALVIIDVLDEYLDDRVDSHRNHSVRRVLQWVRALARRTGCAVLMLRHLRKEASPKAIYRGGGSIGIVGAARAGWAMAYHPDDESVRVLAPVKMNIAVKPQALTLKLIAHDEYPCAFVDWRGTIEMSADELLDGTRHTAEQEEAVTLMQRTIDAIKIFLPEGRENAMLSNELRSQVMGATSCSDKTYKSAHARVTFGIPWRVKLSDGTVGLMVWRPGPDIDYPASRGE